MGGGCSIPPSSADRGLQPRNARPMHWKKLTTEAWSAATSRVPWVWRRVLSSLQRSGVSAKEEGGTKEVP